MTQQTRKLGSFSVSSIGLGCMNLSHAYGVPPEEAEAIHFLNAALDAGYTLLDTAALYGFGANETLVGKALKHRRDEYVLTSKCGMFKNEQGVRTIDGRPEVLRKTCEDSLARLQTDVIDLYYLHRWDKNVPIEESVGALGRLVSEGKIKAIGLSEVSAATLMKAHAEHPITAVQTEYSLWTRNAEIKVLEACREIGSTFVAFSPVARGYLTGKVRGGDDFAENDIRRNMPRFSSENYPGNLKLLAPFKVLAEEAGCSMAQLSLVWLLAQGDHVVPIPGTTNLAHMKDNVEAASLTVSDDLLQKAGDMINDRLIKGERYNTATQSEIDTEQFG